jgi:hypothetical protein
MTFGYFAIMSESLPNSLKFWMKSVMFFFIPDCWSGFLETTSDYSFFRDRGIGIEIVFKFSLSVLDFLMTLSL